MAVDPFNSVGGYTVGIPPMPLVSETGVITAPSATIGNINANNITATGNIEATLFKGSFEGTISGTLVVPGSSTEVLFNDGGNAGANYGFTFDSTAQLVTISGDLVANSFTLGSGPNEFSTSSVMFSVTTSAAPTQVLHTQAQGLISSVDYTIIATDTVLNIRQTSKLIASVLGSEVGYFEYGTIDVPFESPGVADFKVENISGNVVLTVQPNTSHRTTYKIMVTSYKE